MKKSSKIFAIALLTFFASLANASAREMTVDELGTLAYSEHPDTNYIYVIGEYAFTSEHTLTTQDIMLASRSIKMTKEFDGTNKDDALAQMNAGQIIPEMNDDFEITGWTVDNNIVGKNKLEENKKYNIRYIDYKFEPEVSKSDINFDLSDTTKYQTYIDTLKTALKFEADKFYGKNEQGEKKLTYKDGKLSGLLLKNTDVSLNDEDKAKNGQYFFALVVEVPNATDSVTVKMKNLNGEFTSDKDDFDVKPGEDGKVPGMVILVPVDPQDFAVEANKKMTLTIDADGDGKEYEPTEYVIDISDLTLQGESTYEITTNQVTEADKKIIVEDWGYDETTNNKWTLSNGTLTGTLVEQELNEKAYGAANKKGYYFYFTFVLPNNVDVSKVKIQSLQGENGEVKKTYLESEYDTNKNLTILQRIDPSTKCEDGSNCKLYFRIDLDGDEDLYYPTYFTLDYSAVKLEKNSFFTVSGLSDEDKSQYDKNDWYDTDNGYSVTVKQDDTDAHKYNVSGVLPIFDDSSYEDPFDPQEILYYLGLKLTLDADTKIDVSGENNITVKFFHNEDNEDNRFLKVFGDDFGTSNNLYILKALSPDDDKEFTITVDLDGEGVEYEAYTVTIDWSDLFLQTASTGNFGNYDVIEASDLTKDSPEEKDLNNFQFDFKADEAVELDVQNDPENGNVKKGLKGSIKEQTLKEGSFKNPTGFFVPVKIEFPGKDIDELSDYSNKWTLILNTEDGKKKTYNPTLEEYKQGWVMVLFRLKDSKEDAYIRYEIDFDGDSHEFVPQEYTISYQDLNYLHAHEVTIKGTDETITVYDNDKITKELLEEIIPEASDKYHELDTVVYGEQQDFIGKTIAAEDEDFEITVNWKLDADEFVDDVIADLNSTSTTNSDDFSDDFTLSRTDDDITITLKHPGIPLTDLADTSIPGAIAYVLGQDEITKVTLTVGEETVDYTKDYQANNDKSYNDSSERETDEVTKALKAEIIKGAKGAFDKKLENHEDTATLDQLEYDDITFTIKVSETKENIKVVGEEGTEETEKTYTFKFDSDFAVVDQDGNLGAQDLSEAIADGNNYSTVYIDGEYSAQEPIEVNRDVTIVPLSKASAVNALADISTKVSVTDKDYVFDVKKGNVTISDLELSGAKKAEIFIEDGATVTANSIKITAEQDKIDEGILVNSTGKLKVNGITFENETHDTPAIRVEEGGSKITADGLTSQTSPIIDVVHHEKPWCTTDPKNEGEDQLGECNDVSYSDEWSYASGATFYYTKAENVVEYYLIGFMNNYSTKAGMTRVFKKGETDKPIDLIEKDKTVNRDGKNLYFVGYGTIRGDDQNYKDLIFDWSPYHFEQSGKWFFAMYVEQDRTITVDSNITGLNLDAYKGKQYKTYKFTDKSEGMTIGELKKVDPEFKKMWEAVEAANTGGHGQITINEQVASDETKITSDVTLKVTTQVEMG